MVGSPHVYLSPNQCIIMWVSNYNFTTRDSYLQLQHVIRMSIMHACSDGFQFFRQFLKLMENTTALFA